MATLAQCEFPSSDEEDEDYVDSGGSSGGENSQTNMDKKAGECPSMVNKIREKKMHNLLLHMTGETLMQLEHEPTVRINIRTSSGHLKLEAVCHEQVGFSDILLEFQVPQPPVVNKQLPTIHQVFEYLDKCAGSCKPQSRLLEDVEALKNSTRACHPVDSERIKEAVKNLNTWDAEIRVEKTFRFAGQNVTIQQKMKRNSRKYQNYEKSLSGKGRLGGTLSVLDSAMEQLKSLQRISSVEKSRSDCREKIGDYFRTCRLHIREIYREKYNLDEELHNSRKDGYLSKQAFLAAVDSAQEGKSIENNKKKRLLMELSSSRK